MWKRKERLGFKLFVRKRVNTIYRNKYILTHMSNTQRTAYVIDISNVNNIHINL